MKKYLPVWFEDKYGCQYHAKRNSRGEAYIVDAVMSKIWTFKDLESTPVGTTFDVPWLYNVYRVIRNDLCNDEPN